MKTYTEIGGEAAMRPEAPGGRKLVVLGATGGTGLEIVRQALDRGHSVTALVRSPERLGRFRERVEVKRGDLLDTSELAAAIAGHDAVISGFGPRIPLAASDAHLLEQFARALAPAMLQAGVRRVVIESVAFLFRDSIMPPAYLLGRLLFPSIVADAAAMEQIFRESDLDWTLVRPPELKDKPFTGGYRVREGHLPRFGFSISRPDVADFMIRAVENHLSSRGIVGISS
jgi:putative NADH-flavin reductase